MVTSNIQYIDYGIKYIDYGIKNNYSMLKMYPLKRFIILIFP